MAFFAHRSIKPQVAGDESGDNGASFTNYFYALNQQGDVVKIFRPVAVKDADGNVTGYTEKTYATYTYDAWGKLIGITNSAGTSIINKQTTSTSLANLNPLRYRGYYYDNETGFYYLQSRYYDPAVRRFINADTYLSTDIGNAIACNMFAYCINNPVKYGDYTGSVITEVIVAVLGNLIETLVEAVLIEGILLLTCGITYEVGSAIQSSKEKRFSKKRVTSASGQSTPASPPPPNNRNNRNTGYGGETVYNKDGVRIDFEYYGNGNGNVHMHVKGQGKFYFSLTSETLFTEAGALAAPAIQRLLDNPKIWAALEKAWKYVIALGGNDG